MKKIDKAKLELIKTFIKVSGKENEDKELIYKKLQETIKEFPRYFNTPSKKKQFLSAFKIAYKENQNDFYYANIIRIDKYFTKDDLSIYVKFFKSDAGQKYIKFHKYEPDANGKWLRYYDKTFERFAKRLWEIYKKHNEEDLLNPPSSGK